MTLDEMSDANNVYVMNSRHFGSDPADVVIRIRIKYLLMNIINVKKLRFRHELTANYYHYHHYYYYYYYY